MLIYKTNNMQRENKVEVTERWRNGELVEVKANGHTIYPQRENKWQDRFDEKFSHEDHESFLCANYDKKNIFECDCVLKDIKSFIQSEIDTAIAEERERLLKKTEKLFKTEIINGVKQGLFLLNKEGVIKLIKEQ